MIDDTDFTGRRVLVVGGSSGIGNGIAQRTGRATMRGLEVDASTQKSSNHNDRSMQVCLS